MKLPPIVTQLLRKFGGASVFVAGGRLSFLVLVMVAGRLVPATEFGLFMVALATSQILGIAATGGTGPAAQLIVADAISRDRPAIVVGYVRFAVVLTMALSITVSALFLAIGVGARGWLGANSSALSVLTGTGMILVPMAMSTVREYVARALGSIHLAFAPRDIYWTLLLCVLVVILPVARSEFVAVAAISLFAVESVFWVVIWRKALAGIWHRRRDMRSHYRKWLKTSLWMMSNFVAGFSFERIDTLAVGFLGSLEAAGVYGVANRVAPLISLCQRFVVPVALPAIAKAHAAGNAKGVRSEIQHGLLISLLMAGPLFIGVQLFAPYVMAIFGPRFVPGSTTLRILAVAHFALAMQGTLGAALTAAASPSIYSRYAWTALGITAVVLLIATPHFGTAGAATGAAVGICCLFASMALTVWNRFYRLKRA